jgi:hypothetical protein
MEIVQEKRPVMRRVLRFTLHYGEMWLAMAVGMIALGPLWNLGWPGLRDHPALDFAVMVTNMSIAMAVWMRLRRHDWAGIAWMTGAMYASLVVVPPYWAGLIREGDMMMWGHLLMVPLMLLAMLRRPHGHFSVRGTGGSAVADRRA